jgi:FkbM family methyltransferase
MISPTKKIFSMRNKSLIEALVAAERAMDIHLNKAGSSLFVYRLKKMARHPYRYARAAAYKVGGVGERASASTFFGTRVRIPLSDVNATDLYYAGSLRSSEGYVTRFLLSALREGDVFYDVGANYGFYSSLALTLGCFVRAFEPSPHCLSYLDETIELSPNKSRIKLNPVVLSNNSGPVDLLDSSPGHKSGMSTIEPGIAAASGIAHKKVRVNAITLDEYIRTNPAPSVMKIDTEGSEAKVLAGANTLLREHSPVIVIELWGSPQGLANSQEVIGILKNAGYTPHVINQDGSVTPSEIDLGNIGANNNFVFKKRVEP